MLPSSSDSQAPVAQARGHWILHLFFLTCYLTIILLLLLTYYLLLLLTTTSCLWLAQLWKKSLLCQWWVAHVTKHTKWISVTCLERRAQLYLCFFKKIFWPHHMACGILVPWSGIDPGALAAKVLSPNHWAARNSLTCEFGGWYCPVWRAHWWQSFCSLQGAFPTYQ